jgi:hypothetical protein
MSLITIAVVFVVLAAVLLLAWRTIRFFVKLALVGLLLAALLAGLGLWRWQAGTQHSNRPANAPARRTR